MQTGNTSEDHPNTAEDDCRQKFYAVLDTVISCIKDRFMQDDSEMISTHSGAARFESCTWATIRRGVGESCLLLQKWFWQWNLKSPTVPSILSTLSDDTFETFHGVRKALMKLNKPVRCLINEYIKLLKLIIVIPAVSERSLSAMCRRLTNIDVWKPPKHFDGFTYSLRETW